MDATRFRTMTGRWGWLLVLGAVCAFATYAISTRVFDPGAAEHYSATATVLVAGDAEVTQPTTDRSTPAGADIALLTTTYARMIEGPAVSGRLAALFGTPAEADAIRGRISANVVPSTQLVRVTATAPDARESLVIASGAAQAFIAMHDETGMPADVYLFETPPATLVPADARFHLKDAVAVVIAALIVASALVWAFEFATDRVRTASDATTATGSPVLATIPSWRMDDGTIALESERGERAEERYRMLRTAIGLATADDAPRSIAFTAPNRRAGATITAANYAVALALAGRRVALVDADMRTPSLHEHFLADGSLGLAQALTTDTDIDAFMQSSGIDNLTLLTAGGVRPDAPELLASPRFGDVMVALEERFDAVIVDCPPALAVTDAALIAAQADASVLVLRADRTSCRDATAAAEALRRASQRMPGSVLNAEPATLVPSLAKRIAAVRRQRRPTTETH